jgi:hypothetical protein
MSRQQVNAPIQQIVASTPAAPPSGSLKLYPKADGNFYKLTSAGVETALGGGGSSSVPDPLTLGALTVNNSLLIGAVGSAGQIIPRGATNASLAVESPTQYLMLMSKSGTHMGGNLYWDGTNWMHYDTSVGSGLIVAHGAGVDLYSAPASANPATVTSRLSVSLAGLISVPGPLTVGGLLSANGAVTVTGLLTANGSIATNAITNVDWFRVGTTGYGIYNNISGQGIGLPAGGPTNYATGFNLLDTSTAQVCANTTISGGTLNSMTHNGHLTMAAGGYVFGSYINMTADVQGGKPVYVAGTSGDWYMRWWPVASIGPPGSGATPVSVSASSGAVAFNGGNQAFTAVAMPRVGQWIVIAQFTIASFSHPSGNNWPQAQILVNGGGVGVVFPNFDIQGGTPPPTMTYTFAGMVNCPSVNSTTQLYITPAPSSGKYDSYTITAYFVPTPTYPG